MTDRELFRYAQLKEKSCGEHQPRSEPGERSETESEGKEKTMADENSSPAERPRTKRATKEQNCPTCGGPCEKTECDSIPLNDGHAVLHNYKSTAEADARRAAREAAIATLNEIGTWGNRYASLYKWIDDHYPPTGVKE